MFEIRQKSHFWFKTFLKQKGKKFGIIKIGFIFSTSMFLTNASSRFMPFYSACEHQSFNGPITRRIFDATNKKSNNCIRQVDLSIHLIAISDVHCLCSIWNGQEAAVLCGGDELALHFMTTSQFSWSCSSHFFSASVHGHEKNNMYWIQQWSASNPLPLSQNSFSLFTWILCSYVCAFDAGFKWRWG